VESKSGGGGVVAVCIFSINALYVHKSGRFYEEKKFFFLHTSRCWEDRVTCRIVNVAICDRRGTGTTVEHRKENEAQVHRFYRRTQKRRLSTVGQMLQVSTVETMRYSGKGTTVLYC
jgi:hypothetical protein